MAIYSETSRHWIYCDCFVSGNKELSYYVWSLVFEYWPFLEVVYLRLLVMGAVFCLIWITDCMYLFDSVSVNFKFVFKKYGSDAEIAFILICTKWYSHLHCSISPNLINSRYGSVVVGKISVVHPKYEPSIVCLPSNFTLCSYAACTNIMLT